MRVEPIKTCIFKEGEPLFEFIIEHLPRVEERSVIAVTSKIVSFAERRLRLLDDERSKERYVKSESDWMLKTEFGTLTVRDGSLMLAAGVDESNGGGKLVLLPSDSFRSARLLRSKLLAHYGLKELGVVITDSRTPPLRRGVLGVALGYADFKGTRPYKGTKDIFGRVFRTIGSTTNVADSLAASAVFVMGEGAERQPLALITGGPVEFTDVVQTEKLLRLDPRDDLYLPFFERARKIRFRKKKR